MEKINAEQFNELVLESKGKVVVDFFADWCGPCKMLGPVLEDLANDRAEIKIVKINVDDNPNVARTYGIMSIPSLLLFKNGKLVDQKMGYMAKELLTEWIEKNK